MSGPRAVAASRPWHGSIRRRTSVAGVIRPAGPASAPVVIDGAAWVSLDTRPAIPGYLARLSSEQDAVDFALSPGPDFGGGGDLVVAAGSAWVIDGGNDRILRLPLAGFSPAELIAS